MDIQLNNPHHAIPRKYWAWIGGGAAALLLLGWLAFGGLADTQSVERRGLSISEVQRKQFNDYVSLDGTVVPVSVVQISPEEGGVVMEKVAEEGTKVRKGDVIVRLSNSSLDLQILNAESELAEKQNMLRNTQISMEQEALTNRNDQLQQDMEVERKRRKAAHMETLYKEQLISREDYLEAKEDYLLAQKKHALIGKRISQDAKYRKAQTAQMTDNLDNMRRNLEMVRERKAKLNICSAIDGEVGSLDVELGQNIAPGQKIGVVNDMTDYKIQAMCNEHYIDRVHKGLTANFSQNGKTYTVTVSKVFPEVKDGRFKIELRFTGKRPENIRTGQTYYLDLQLGASSQALVIPKGTFFSTTAGAWIFVLDKSGKKAYRRKITLGRQNPKFYEVIEGLEAGEKVITSGYEGFKEGETLRIK